MTISNDNSFAILCCFFGLILSACQSTGQSPEAINTTYTISGKVENSDAKGPVILSQFDPVSQTKTPLDTATTSAEGTYQLTFEFTEPDLFRVDYPNRQYVMLVLAVGQNNVELNVEGTSKGWAKVNGSADSQKLIDYDDFRNESYNRVVKPTYDAMREATDAGNHEAEIEAVKNYAEASEVHRKELIDFTQKNIGTSIALYGSMLRWTGDDEVGKLETLVQNFKAAHPDLKMTKVMEDKVQRFKKVAIGATVPPIALLDNLGNPSSLAAVKGKYTLIDFWASWCSPCILQIPDLKAVYKTYHSKGFEIVGVSVDSKEDRWKRAINKHEMNWPHLSDLKGWGSKAAADYNVTFIPFNLLIDENGKIIAKNLHSKSLESQLKKLLP